jgi:hypothetical protein
MIISVHLDDNIWWHIPIFVKIERQQQRAFYMKNYMRFWHCLERRREISVRTPHFEQNEYRESSWGVKGGQRVRLTPHSHLWADCLDRMWEPRRLTTLWASTAYYSDSFTSTFYPSALFQQVFWFSNGHWTKVCQITEIVTPCCVFLTCCTVYQQLNFNVDLLHSGTINMEHFRWEVSTCRPERYKKNQCCTV